MFIFEEYTQAIYMVQPNTLTKIINNNTKGLVLSLLFPSQLSTKKRSQKTFSCNKDPNSTKTLMNPPWLTRTFSSYSSIKTIMIVFMPGNSNDTNTLPKYLIDLNLRIRVFHR